MPGARRNLISDPLSTAEKIQAPERLSQPSQVDALTAKPNRWLWLTVISVGALIVYWLGVGVAFRWIHAARTQKEFLERKAAVDHFYAPLIWVQSHEPTGLLLVLNNQLIRVCIEDPRFSRMGKLPLE